MDISIIKADDRHIDQLVDLLITTSYDIASAKYNTLNLDSISYIREYKVKPLIPFIYVAVNSSDTLQVLGMLAAGPKNKILNYTQKSFSHPETKKIFKKFYDIHETDIPDSYYIFRLAVNKDSRNKGIGKKLFNYAEDKAKALGFSKLTLVTWSSQVDAITLYLKLGMEIKKCYHISDKLPYPNLLYLEKNFDTKFIQNYFESTEYVDLKLV